MARGGINAMVKIDKLLKLLAESKREHEHCDDCWYCCRACRHPDHMLLDGDHLGIGFDDPCFNDPASSKPGTFKPGTCTCGVAAWNAKVNDTLKEFAFIT